MLMIRTISSSLDERACKLLGFYFFYRKILKNSSPYHEEFEARYSYRHRYTVSKVKTRRDETRGTKRGMLRHSTLVAPPRERVALGGSSVSRHEERVMGRIPEDPGLGH
ncbi:hypothetical protein KQX54_004874 [Cotesia glomerata]|uniref:Uncharacterized protein n=1 Tax=Cotesia glomerata TaxID=32391 RepID=A0AAV7HXW8_COTGL|nr:hypothetical protein KQX54_004874 [Cotesia glomerata]